MIYINIQKLYGCDQNIVTTDKIILSSLERKLKSLSLSNYFTIKRRKCLSKRDEAIRRTFKYAEEFFVKFSRIIFSYLKYVKAKKNLFYFELPDY